MEWPLLKFLLMVKDQECLHQECLHQEWPHQEWLQPEWPQPEWPQPEWPQLEWQLKVKQLICKPNQKFLHLKFSILNQSSLKPNKSFPSQLLLEKSFPNQWSHKELFLNQSSDKESFKPQSSEKKSSQDQYILKESTKNQSLMREQSTDQFQWMFQDKSQSENNMFNQLFTLNKKFYKSIEDKPEQSITLPSPDQPNTPTNNFTKTFKLQQKKSSPNQSTKELLLITPKRSTSLRVNHKLLIDNQSLDKLKFNKDQDLKLSLDQEKKSTIKLTFNQSFKERTFKLNLIDNKIRPLTWTLLLNKPSITLLIEFRLFRLLLNKSSLNQLFKSMFIKEIFIMFKDLLWEEFLSQDLFLFQLQFLTKFLLLEESQFQLPVKRIEELRLLMKLMFMFICLNLSLLSLPNLQNLKVLNKLVLDTPIIKMDTVATTEINGEDKDVTDLDVPDKECGWVKDITTKIWELNIEEIILVMPLETLPSDTDKLIFKN